jgi:hypothetical protein
MIHEQRSPPPPHTPPHPTPPSVQADTSEFVARVKSALALFLTFDEPGSAASSGGKLYGKAAADKLFEAVKEMVRANDTPITLKTFTSVHVFGWLLTSAQERVVKAWTDAELSKGNVDGLPQDGKAASSSRGPRGPRKAASQDVRSQVAALLTN